ncbi:hypothetical protein HMPREF9520_00626, partial [Enterococcus faecalis TX1467]
LVSGCFHIKLKELQFLVKKHTKVLEFLCYKGKVKEDKKQRK